MPIKVGSRPAPKGVEFSDHLIVLGAASPASHPRKHSSLPVGDDNATPFHTSPSLPYRPSGKPRARFFDHAPDLISDCKLTPPPRAFDEPVETSCTDSEEDHAPYPNQANPQPYRPPLDQTLEACTRINTKLNSLPSGGAFSLMNSSEDVHLSSSDEENLSSSRKLIRVQGSAKLSNASDVDEEFDIDDDEFAIEGAEKVDEEEAVNVRSFGRSFARVCLKDDVDDDDQQQPSTWEKEKEESHVTLDVPGDQIVADDSPQPVDEQPVTVDSSSQTAASSAPQKTAQQVFAESRSAPPRRKSRLRLTFVRRASIADREEPKPEPTTTVGTIPNRLDDSVSGVTRLSCFPMRKSPTKHRTKFSDIKNTSSRDTEAGSRPAIKDGSHQVVAVPEFDLRNRKPSRTRKNRKMVKNVSMQRDDWIDFATNSPHRQRSQWLSRLISHSGGDSEASSKRDSRGVKSESRRESRNSGWKFLRFWSRK